MNASLRNRDRLLLHSLVDRCLILRVHLVELVDTADSVISKHQRSRLDAVLTSLHVLAHGCSKTCCGGTLTRRVDCSGQELLNVLEELRFCGGWIAHNADVYVTS